MKKINYEEAVKQLEEIVEKMESGELDLDSMTTQLKKAQELVKLCKNRLMQTDKDIQGLLENK
ncbi:exodeoxyribonuclease VII small subunit [Prevotella amnii]|uniref:Exodeoxyribonuclease 7 small subunit n=2 Tax=Prevotella amnii TaxID=419005 RepID=A0A096B244_9BACT|nr:exodeoxyribonuclease VII small subunit [Prevotella amnii]KGF53036.1 exodeoxyribonuclease VII [Prevotella amnii DNF00058]KXB81977.1 putative exodeoxyribonuclease VII, small subunit [Prevotella amnii]